MQYTGWMVDFDAPLNTDGNRPTHRVTITVTGDRLPDGFFFDHEIDW